MDGHEIVKQFGRMGARAKVRFLQGLQRALGVRLDVLRDGRGEWFDIALEPDIEARVVDVRPDQRHLLLMTHDGAFKQRFLCGHDERHWFVAGVPDDRGVSNVRTAMEALKPLQVRQAQERAGLRGDDRTKRKNRAFLRQGEWFFIPRPDTVVDRRLILTDEPLVRAGPRGHGKAHWVDELIRTGGEAVHVARDGLMVTPEVYGEIVSGMREEWRHKGWRIMRRNPTVLVRGRVRHPDHATIVLDGWHEVRMNEEHRAPGRERIAFLD